MYTLYIRKDAVLDILAARKKRGEGHSHEENLTPTWDLPNQFKRGMGERGKDKEDTIFLLPPLGPT